MYSSTSNRISIRNIRPLKLHAENINKIYNVELMATNINSTELQRLKASNI